MTISATITTLLVSFVIPALVALLTKITASSALKQILSALLAAVTGLIVAATTIDGHAEIRGPAVLLALGAFISAQATYVAVYRPHGLNAALAPGVGLGTDTPGT